MKFVSSFSKTFSFVFFVLIFCVFFAPATPAHAQTESFRVTILPQYPGPFEKVSVAVEDFSRDLNSVDITWSVNGKVVKKGTGLKNLDITTGDFGSASNISINMGSTVRTLTIAPTAVDMLWQADTYTPPFYEGKALHSNQDPITIEAEPFFITTKGTRLDPTKLIYTWKNNDTVDQNASGYGKNVYRYTPSILLKPIDVSVDVTTSDNSFYGHGEVNIDDTGPEILLYENNPLYGILFNNALNDRDITLSTQEINVIGSPFYFSNNQARAGLLAYTWQQNGSTVNEGNDELIFRKPADANANGGASSGRSSISLAVKNLERIMQNASASTHLMFTVDQSNQTAPPVF